MEPLFCLEPEPTHFGRGTSDFRSRSRPKMWRLRNTVLLLNKSVFFPPVSIFYSTGTVTTVANLKKNWQIARYRYFPFWRVKFLQIFQHFH